MYIDTLWYPETSSTIVEHLKGTRENIGIIRCLKGKRKTNERKYLGAVRAAGKDTSILRRLKGNRKSIYICTKVIPPNLHYSEIHIGVP